MSKRKRRGSSTRKFRQENPILPVVNVRRKTAEKTDKPTDKGQKLLDKLTQRLMDGVNGKGKPLTDEEISKTKVRIANVEHELGIKHE